MKLVVIPPVLVFGLDALAHLDTTLWGNSHIATVEQNVQVRAKEKTVGNLVGPFPVGLDIRRLEHGQGSLAGDRTAFPIGSGHQDSERALAQPRSRQIVASVEATRFTCVFRPSSTVVPEDSGQPGP